MIPQAYNRLLKYILILHLTAGCTTGWCQSKKHVADSGAWLKLKGVLAQIKAPTFKNKDYVITKYGAVGNGTTNCSEAIKKAINACNKAGGGRVVVPAGNFYTGPVYLKSNVNLHLNKGAKLLFSTRPDDYLPLVPTRWEGVELMNYSSLIYAYKEHNIAITGEGVLDGQATNENWWPWKGKAEYGWKPGTPNQTDKGNRPVLFDMAEKDVPLADRKFGNGHYLRPQFVQPYLCDNILIQGVKIINSPMWILHPVLCNNMTIDGVNVESSGPNTDGCDPESCKNVLIKNCYFNTGDDCIAIKSGRNRDGRRINIPSENIVIQNCTMANGHGGIVIGSEISGGVKNVFAENCQMNSPLLDRALRIKTSSARGGVTDGIYLRNINVGQVKEEAILITMFYEDTGEFMPTIRNIEVQNMQVEKGGKTGIVVEGYTKMPVQNLKLKNVNIKSVKTPYRLSNVSGLMFNNVIVNGTLLKQQDVTINTNEQQIHW